MSMTPWVVAAVSGVIVTFWCMRAIKKAKDRGGAHQLVPFYRCLLYYVIPFTIALSLLLGVDAYLHYSPGSLTYGELSTAQRWVDRVHGIFNKLKLAEWQILLILLAVFAINYAVLFWRRDVPRPLGLPYKIVKPYHIIIASLSVLFGVLCAFTFLGTELGAPRQEMELRLRAIEHGYAKLVEKTNHALADRTPSALVDKAMRSLPNDYIVALRPTTAGAPNLPSQIDATVGELDTYYGQIRNRYQVQDPVVERLLAQEKARMARVAQLPRLLSTIPPPPPQPLSPRITAITTPGWASEDTIAAASKSLDAVRPQGDFRLLQEGGVEVRVQLGVTVREAVARLVEPVFHAFPMGGPLLEAISGLADQAIEERIRAASPPAAANLLRDPAHPETVIDQAARTIADKVAVTNASATHHAALISLGQAEQDLRSLGDARRHLDITVTDVLLERLPNGTQQEADAVSTELAARSDVITPQQVRQLTDIMRTGTQSWTGDAYVPWPGSHCTCWKNTSVSYYAALALQNMDTPLVSDALRSEAQQVEANAVTYTKVTDPGWECSVNGSSTPDAICGQGQGGFGGSAVSSVLRMRHRCWFTPS